MGLYVAFKMRGLKKFLSTLLTAVLPFPSVNVSVYFQVEGRFKSFATLLTGIRRPFYVSLSLVGF